MGRESELATRIRRVVGSIELGWWVYALVIGAVVAFVGFVYLPWIVFGLFVYYVARPIERRVEPLMPSKNLAAALTLAVVVVPIVGILGGAIVFAVVQVSTFLTGDFVVLVDQFAPVVANRLPQDPAVLVGSLFASLSSGTIQSVFSSVAGTVGSVASGLFNAFLSLLFAFFLLREDTTLSAWFRSSVADEGTDTHRYLVAVDEGLESVYFGYTVTIFVVMILAAITYSGFNLIAPPSLAIPAPFTLAIVTGLFTIIPLVGRSIVYAVLTAYFVLVALRTDPTTLWFPIAFFVVMEIPFDNLIRIYIRPALSGRIFPMSLLVFAYLIGPPLFGWYGIFYGPFLLVIVVLFLQLKLPTLLHPDRATTAFDSGGEAAVELVDELDRQFDDVAGDRDDVGDPEPGPSD